MSARLLELTDFGVAYGAVQAVHKLALTVHEGEIVTVIGPNGAGKSTLLCAAMGLLPSSGTLALDGRTLVRPTVEMMVAAGVALVPEKRELFGEMSVEDNLLLGGFWRWRKGQSVCLPAGAFWAWPWPQGFTNRLLPRWCTCTASAHAARSPASR